MKLELSTCHRRCSASSLIPPAKSTNRPSCGPTRVSFTREELLRDVWGFRVICPTRTIDSHAHRLRKKLNVGEDRFLVNVWGVGYRLVDGNMP